MLTEKLRQHNAYIQLNSRKYIVSFFNNGKNNPHIDKYKTFIQLNKYIGTYIGVQFPPIVQIRIRSFIPQENELLFWYVSKGKKDAVTSGSPSKYTDKNDLGLSITKFKKDIPMCVMHVK